MRSGPLQKSNSAGHVAAGYCLHSPQSYGNRVANPHRRRKSHEKLVDRLPAANSGRFIKLFDRYPGINGAIVQHREAAPVIDATAGIRRVNITEKPDEHHTANSLSKRLGAMSS